MLYSTEVLTLQTQAQLDRLLSIQRVALGCCESAIKVHSATTRKLIGQINGNFGAASKGQAGDLMVGIGKVFVDHWEASVGYTLLAQQQLVDSLGQMPGNTATKRK